MIRNGDSERWWEDEHPIHVNAARNLVARGHEDSISRLHGAATVTNRAALADSWLLQVERLRNIRPYLNLSKASAVLASDFVDSS
jgi:hypothetical protein